MEETYNTEAIILDRIAFREADLKLVVFSQDKGKLELVARGARKLKSRLAAHIEPMTLARLMVVRSRNEYDLLGASCGNDFFPSLKDDLGRLTQAGRALKLVNNLSRPGEEEGERVFFLLKSFLNFLKRKNETDFDLFYDFFTLKFLALIGFAPNLQTCINCDIKAKRGGNFFDLGQGGILCKKCCSQGKESILEVSDDCLKVLKFSLGNDFGKLSNLKINKELNKEIKEKISSFLKYNFYC